MENLEDLKKRYEELGKEIEKLEKGRVKDKTYYCIEDNGEVITCKEDFVYLDDEIFKLGNYFKSVEEAEKVTEKILIYNELKRLAERLNNGRKIDWNDSDQRKYYIFLANGNSKRLKRIWLYTSKCIGEIYCLDEDFLDIALKEIGEDRLKKLFE